MIPLFAHVYAFCVSPRGFVQSSRDRREFARAERALWVSEGRVLADAARVVDVAARWLVPLYEVPTVVAGVAK